MAAIESVVSEIAIIVRVDMAGLEGLERMKVDNIVPSVYLFVFPVGVPASRPTSEFGLRHRTMPVTGQSEKANSFSATLWAMRLWRTRPRCVISSPTVDANKTAVMGKLCGKFGIFLYSSC